MAAIHGSRERRWLHLAAAVPLIAALVVGCAHTSPVSPPAWESFGYSGCKDDLLGDAADRERDAEACIQYDYDGAGTLRLTHIDAACNCGAIEAGGDIEFLPGHEIHIETWEEVLIPQTCLCLFDVSYTITSLCPGTYRLTVQESYLYWDDDQFDFVLDLHGACSGEVCLPRSDYPW